MEQQHIVEISFTQRNRKQAVSDIVTTITGGDFSHLKTVALLLVLCCVAYHSVRHRNHGKCNHLLTGAKLGDVCTKQNHKKTWTDDVTCLLQSTTLVQS